MDRSPVAGVPSTLGSRADRCPCSGAFRSGGFTPLKRKVYQVVNLMGFSRVEGTTINAEILKEAGLIRSTKGLVKVLAMGDVSEAYTVEAHKFSSAAVAKIEAAGGTVRVTKTRTETVSDG